MVQEESITHLLANNETVDTDAFSLLIVDAVRYEKVAVFEQLMRRLPDGFNLNAFYTGWGRNCTLLHMGAEGSDGDKAGVIVQSLLQAGADMHIQDKDGNTPFDYAMTVQAVRLLTEAGADVNRLSSHKQTALHRAVEIYNGDSIVYLLEVGADPDIEDSNGRTPYEMAMFYQSEKFSSLIERKVAPKISRKRCAAIGEDPYMPMFKN